MNAHYNENEKLYLHLSPSEHRSDHLPIKRGRPWIDFRMRVPFPKVNLFPSAFFPYTIDYLLSCLDRTIKVISSGFIMRIGNGGDFYQNARIRPYTSDQNAASFFPISDLPV